MNTSAAINASMLRLVAECLRVFRTRDGLPITEAQIDERARNIVCALAGNYNVTSFDDEEA